MALTKMLRIADKTLDALRAGEWIGGHAWPVGAAPRLPATLSWSPEDGALVQLIEPTQEWGLGFGREFVMHFTIGQGEEITLLTARVRRMDLMDAVSAVGSYTLAVGAHVDPGDRWRRAQFATANQSGWRPVTGIRFSRPREEPVHVRLDWAPPAAETVAVENGDRLTFATTMSSSGSTLAPDWSITTAQIMDVEPAVPRTIDELHRQHAEPLRALMTFASDRPDGLTREIVSDKGAGRTAEVWRQGPQVTSQPWRLVDGDFLFRADQLLDFAAAIRTWWALYEQVYPALGVFAEHVLEGSSYSPARLLTAYSALEAYGHERHRSKSLKKVRDYAGVPAEVTGCTNPALTLLGFCRDYFAHFHPRSSRFSRADADAGAFPSVRRVSALMQACLLRELGFATDDIVSLLGEHYAHWPLP